MQWKTAALKNIEKKKKKEPVGADQGARRRRGNLASRGTGNRQASLFLSRHTNLEALPAGLMCFSLGLGDRVHDQS
jgi:hypothetical protein